MNYAFLGTPRFAEIVLEKLIKKGFMPSLVVCNPDRPVGRKKIITSPPTKILAEKNNIPVWQPEKLAIEEAEEKLNGIDVAVVAAYGKIIPKSVLELPKHGTIGVHPSLLPHYRGASPLQTAILDGANETGVSLFIVDEEIDHGPIVAQRAVELVTQTYLELESELATIGADLLIEKLAHYVNGEIKPMSQDEADATFTKKFDTEDARVDLEHDTPEIVWRKVRALNPEPGVFAMKNGKRMKILEAQLTDKRLILKKVQFEGGVPQEFS